MRKAETFKPLQDIYKMRRRIWQTEDAIDSLIARHTAPKSQILSDMPEGGGGKKEIEEYLIRKEALLLRLKKQREAIYILWLAFLNGYDGFLLLTPVEKTLLRCRYYHGYKWKKCIRKLQTLYPAEVLNENVVYATHRRLIKALNNSYYFD